MIKSPWTSHYSIIIPFYRDGSRRPPGCACPRCPGNKSRAGFWVLIVQFQDGLLQPWLKPPLRRGSKTEQASGTWPQGRSVCPELRMSLSCSWPCGMWGIWEALPWPALGSRAGSGDQSVPEGRSESTHHLPSVVGGSTRCSIAWPTFLPRPNWKRQDSRDQNVSLAINWNSSPLKGPPQSLMTNDFAHTSRAQIIPKVRTPGAYKQNCRS